MRSVLFGSNAHVSDMFAYILSLWSKRFITLVLKWLEAVQSGLKGCV